MILIIMFIHSGRATWPGLLLLEAGEGGTLAGSWLVNYLNGNWLVAERLSAESINSEWLRLYLLCQQQLDICQVAAL